MTNLVNKSEAQATVALCDVRGALLVYLFIEFCSSVYQHAQCLLKPERQFPSILHGTRVQAAPNNKQHMEIAL